jgi:flagellar biosynthesis anti-sigma factor FlgM
MKFSPSTTSVSPSSLSSFSEGSKESGAVARTGDASKAASPATASVSAQVDLRSSRINDLSDTAWINEPPALDTAMLDQIKTAIREGRFVINEQAIAQALSDDASR